VPRDTPSALSQHAGHEPSKRGTRAVRWRWAWGEGDGEVCGQRVRWSQDSRQTVKDARALTHHEQGWSGGAITRGQAMDLG
jgi:hypothetical protein